MSSIDKYKKEASEKTITELVLLIILLVLTIIGGYKIYSLIDFETKTMPKNAYLYVVLTIAAIISVIYMIISIIKDISNEITSEDAELINLEVIEEDPNNELLEGYRFIFKTADGKRYEWFDSERNIAEEGEHYTIVLRNGKILGVISNVNDEIIFGEEAVDEWRY